MKTLGEVLTLSADYLDKKGIQNARRQAEQLLADLLGIGRIDIYMSFDKPLNAEEVELCRERLKRRGAGEPLEYIHGEVEFYHCNINVNKNVLIPRPETEILVDKVVKELKSVDLKGKELWDLCCGSGCIGIAIKKAFPDLKVVLIDISRESLNVAEINAEKNGVEVEIIESDLFSSLHGRQAHYILCNPPYISKEEYENLDREVKDWEPQQALVAEGKGLACYEKIADQLKDYLFPGGKAWFETGASQGSELIEMFKKESWRSQSVEKDWAGHDRFFSLENE